MKKGRIRKEYFFFLPNMVTLFNLFSGFLSLVMASYGHYATASWLLVLSLVWDSLDGNIARMFNNPSDLGRELDSLADVVSFVVAPAFLMSRFLLQQMNTLWMFAFLCLYLAAGTYRLARFNVRPPVKDYFEGLPTPAAAMTLVMTVLAALKNDWTHLQQFAILSTLLTLSLSFLMVSRVHYPKLSALKFVHWRSLFYLGSVFFVIVGLIFNLESACAAVFYLFLFLSPIYCVTPQSVVVKADIE